MLSARQLISEAQTPGLSRGTSQQSGGIKINLETSGLWIWELQMLCKYKVCAGCHCCGGGTELQLESQTRPTWVVAFVCSGSSLKHESYMKLFQQFLNVWEVTKSFFHSGLWSLPFCLFTARVQDHVIHPSSIFWVRVCPEPWAVLPQTYSSFKWHTGRPSTSLPSSCFWRLSWFIRRVGCVWLFGVAFNSTPSFHMKTRWSNF